MFQKERAEIEKFAHANDIKEDTEGALEIIAEARIRQMTKETDGDQVLGNALLKYADSHPGGNAFLVGAMFAYFPIKRLYLEREKADHGTTLLKNQETNRRIDHLDLDHPELADVAREIDLSLPIDIKTFDEADIGTLISEIEVYLGKQP